MMKYLTENVSKNHFRVTVPLKTTETILGTSVNQKDSLKPSNHNLLKPLLAYEIRRQVDERGDAVFAKTEFQPGDVIFSELPTVLCPYDRRLVCFHCCLPIESINEAARRMAKDPKFSGKSELKTSLSTLET